MPCLSSASLSRKASAHRTDQAGCRVCARRQPAPHVLPAGRRPRRRPFAAVRVGSASCSSRHLAGHSTLIIRTFLNDYRRRSTTMRKLCVLFVLMSGSASAQWLNHPTPGAPRTRDGKIDLTARAPRAADGKPDLSGVWHVEPTTMEEWKRLLGKDLELLTATSPLGMEGDTVSKYAVSVLMDFKPEDAPMRPEAAKIFGERAQALGRDLPSTNCLPIGLPMTYLVSEMHKVVQTPGLILVMYE